MRIFLTGGMGFLGAAVTKAALARGHAVRSYVRSADPSAPPTPGLEVVTGDVRDREALRNSMAEHDVAVHLAAAKEGDVYSQLSTTVGGTENLIEAMNRASLKRLVLVSSFAVYAYGSVAARSTIDEDTPLDPQPHRRDPYATAKYLQEQCAHDGCRASGISLTVLRPGVVIGPGNLWSARLGYELGSKAWLRIGFRARLPVTYVDNCAEAIVLAAEHSVARPAETVSPVVFNIVDDDLPTLHRYASLLRGASRPKPRVVPVPRAVVSGVGALAARNANASEVHPLIRRAVLDARCKPFRFDNSRIKRDLGWRPRVGLEEALERSLGGAA
jgi:nucleoside-diphosphate-sugar epimerase